MEILDSIPDKREYTNTTSLKFKEDLIGYFTENKMHTILEVGADRGYTTRILSFLFDKVISFEFNEEKLEFARKLNSDRDNIQFINKDVYRNDWEVGQYDVVFIDCDHQYDSVIADTINAIKWADRELLIIYDDYGHPTTGVKRAVDDLLEKNDGLSLVKYMGEAEGSDCRPGLILKDYEGVMCKYV